MPHLSGRDRDLREGAVDGAVDGLVADGGDRLRILLAVGSRGVRADVDAPLDGSVPVRRGDDDVLVIGLVRQSVRLGKPERLPAKIVEVRVGFERGDDRPIEREQREGEERQQPRPGSDMRTEAAPERHMFSRRRNWSMAKTITAMIGNMKSEMAAPLPR